MSLGNATFGDTSIQSRSQNQKQKTHVCCVKCNCRYDETEIDFFFSELTKTKEIGDLFELATVWPPHVFVMNSVRQLAIIDLLGGNRPIVAAIKVLSLSAWLSYCFRWIFYCCSCCWQCTMAHDFWLTSTSRQRHNGKKKRHHHIHAPFWLLLIKSSILVCHFGRLKIRWRCKKIN